MHRRSGAGARVDNNSGSSGSNVLVTQETGTITTKKVAFYEGDEEKRPTPNSNSNAEATTRKRSEKKEKKKGIFFFVVLLLLYFVCIYQVPYDIYNNVFSQSPPPMFGQPCAWVCGRCRPHDVSYYSLLMVVIKFGSAYMKAAVMNENVSFFRFTKHYCTTSVWK